MDEQTIDFRDIFALLLRNIWTIIFCVGSGAAIAYGITTLLQEQYKAKAEVSINANYFQNPLVNNLITDVYDPNELKGQRQALLQQALTVAFLDKLGEDYGEFTENVSREKHALEREKLSSRIQVFSLGANAFQVSIIANNRQKSLDMVKAIIAQMEKTVIEQRNETLMSTKAAIKAHIKKLNKVLPEPEDQSKFKSTAKVKQELDKAQLELQLMKQRFADVHPEVQALRRKINLLQNQYNMMPKPEIKKATTNGGLLGAPSAQKPLGEVRDELIRNLINIDIVLEKEKNRNNVSYFSVTEQPTLPAKPFFPNVLIFVAAGAGLGAVLAALITAYVEFKRGTFSSPTRIAEQLDMPLLGELPYDKDMAQELLLDTDMSFRRSQKLLQYHRED